MSDLQHTPEQILAAVEAEATAFGRCCDCYQDGLGGFCCHDCGQKTMAMLNGVQRVLGVHGKLGKPRSPMETSEARKSAILRGAAPDLLDALTALVKFFDGADALSDVQKKCWVADFTTSTYPNTAALYEQAKTAIAKATA